MTATPAEEFTAIFRDEHRRVRDALLALEDAFRDRDTGRARQLLGELAALAGPHFRYEEESLYPSLVQLFGLEYVEKLLVDHDGAIGRAARLVELAEVEPLADGEIAEAVGHVRAILPHVSDCDGLSIMVEVLPSSTASAILETRERSLAENLDLLSWAAGPRARPSVRIG